MLRSIPMKARAAPIGWLILSGFTAQDLFDVVTMAIVLSPVGAALRGRPGFWATTVGCPYIRMSHGAGFRTCAQIGLWMALSISSTSVTIPSYPA